MDWHITIIFKGTPTQWEFFQVYLVCCAKTYTWQMREIAITWELDKKIFPYDKLVGMLEMTTSEKISYQEWWHGNILQFLQITEKKEQLAYGFQVKNILKPNDILLSSKIGVKSESHQRGFIPQLMETNEEKNSQILGGVGETLLKRGRKGCKTRGVKNIKRKIHRIN